MIHFPKPKFLKPQARIATRSKAGKLAADQKRRAFLAAAAAAAKREEAERAAAQEQEERDLRQQRRDEEADYFKPGAVEGMDSTIGAPL